MTSNDKLKKSIIWNSIGNFFYFFLQWILMYLVTILLGVTNQAMFTVCISVGNIAGNFASFGMRNYQVSDINDKFSDQTYINSRILTCFGASLIAILWTLTTDYSMFKILCIAAYTVFKMSEVFVDVYHGIIQKQMRMDMIGKSYIIRGITTTIFFVTAVVLTDNLLIGIIAMIFAAYIPIFFYDGIKVKEFIKKNLNMEKNALWKLLLICAPITVYLTLLSSIPSIPRIFMGQILGDEQLGNYSAIATPAVIIQVCTVYIFAPFVGIFSEHYINKQFTKFVNLFLKILFVIILFSIGIIVGAYFFTDFGLRILYQHKPEILQYAYLFIPILFYTVLYSIAFYLSTILIVFRNFVGIIAGSLVGTICCYAGCSYFIHKYKLNGANYILIISLSLQILILLGFIVLELYRLRKASKSVSLEAR